MLACAQQTSTCRDCGGGDQAGGDPAPSDSGGDSLGDPGGDTSGTHNCGQSADVTLPRLWPEPGELFYLQVGLSGVAIGESAITVWPDGRIVLIDLGNNSHVTTIVGILNDVIAQMNARGFANRSPNSADHVILTHHHADHTDGLANFLSTVTLTGRVVMRGYYDLVGVDSATISSSCNALASHAGMELAMCSGPTESPCSTATTYPADTCSPAAANTLLTFAAGDRIRLVAVNGFIGADSYEDQVAPFLTENNGENARSVVGVLEHGAFRLLFNGDLTGGGSSTDAVEGFYLPRLGAVSDLAGLGVDVLHAGHHARNTSTSSGWGSFLLPADGRNRNVVMGVSEAHIRSPYQEVLDVIFASSRLASGMGWTTRVAFLGQSDARLVDAGGGHIVVRTFDGGSGYYVQALATNGSVLVTRRYDSVRACP